MHLTLVRKISANKAIISELVGLSRKVYVLEDEWNDNKPRESCIPAGTYTVKPHGWELRSPFKYKQVWQLQNVPGRTAILIHGGNFIQDTEGCLLAGFGIQISQTQSMVTDSRLALKYLREEIGERTFKLTIVNAWDIF